nr:recombinase family protein [Deinococcus sp. LM3]
MQIGYARVSKQHEQDTAAQLRALKDGGAERVFTEHASGAAGTGPNSTRCSTSSEKGMWSSSGSWTDSAAASRICFT